MTDARFWVDDVAGATVPADDRGLLLADGVFETLRWRGGRFDYRQWHDERLAHGLAVLGFEGPGALAASSLDRAAASVAGEMVDQTAVVRVTVTRGSGPRGYRPPPTTLPRLIVGCYPADPMPFQPLSLGWTSVRWSSQPLLSGSKALARTEQVLAASDAVRRRVDDVLMQNADGHVISSSCANVLVRFGRELLTPAIVDAGIAGTRLAVIRDSLAERHDLSVREVPVSYEDLLDADEIMLCNAVRGVQSVKQLGDRHWQDFSVGQMLYEDLRLGSGDR